MKIQLNIGEKKGKLILLKEITPIKLPCGIAPRRILCQCECGEKHSVLLLHWRRNRTLSCGCVRKTKNGESHQKIYKLWKSIIERCYTNDKKRKSYKSHYLKGIKVCDVWINSYESFKEWALNNGYSPFLQIDRIDNNKGYSPDNCRFVTQIQNLANRDLTIKVNYKNEITPLTILLAEKQMMKSYDTIRRRIKKGWNHELAIDTPIRKIKGKVH